MIKIDKDIQGFSDVQLDTALMLIDYELKSQTRSPNLKALLARRKEMMEIEKTDRENIAKLKARYGR